MLSAVLLLHGIFDKWKKVLLWELSESYYEVYIKVQLTMVGAGAYRSHRQSTLGEHHERSSLHNTKLL